LAAPGGWGGGGSPAPPPPPPSPPPLPHPLALPAPYPRLALRRYVYTIYSMLAASVFRVSVPCTPLPLPPCAASRTAFTASVGLNLPFIFQSGADKRVLQGTPTIPALFSTPVGSLWSFLRLWGNRCTVLRHTHAPSARHELRRSGCTVLDRYSAVLDGVPRSTRR
jgi:hypothetical protein